MITKKDKSVTKWSNKRRLELIKLVFFLNVFILVTILFAKHNVVLSLIHAILIVYVIKIEKNKTMIIIFILVVMIMGTLPELTGTYIGKYSYTNPFLLTIPLWVLTSWSLLGVITHKFDKILRDREDSKKIKIKKYFFKNKKLWIFILLYFCFLYSFLDKTISWNGAFIILLTTSVLALIIEFKKEDLISFFIISIFSWCFEFIMVSFRNFTYFDSLFPVPISIPLSYSLTVILSTKIIYSVVE